MTKRPNQPPCAQRTGSTPRVASFSGALVHTSAKIALLLAVALVFGALLAGCTRDRPIAEGEVTTLVDTSGVAADPASADAPAADTPAAAALTSGEPEVEVSEVLTDSVDGTPNPDALTKVEYEVASGDTLLSIATKFNTTTQAIRDTNRLATDLIQIGQTLTVMVPPAEPTPTPEPFYYIVQPGDSLTGIADALDVPWTVIVTANKMPDANALKAGMSLMIPGYSPATGATDAAGAAGEETTAAAVDPSEQATHTIKAGETLTEIARMYDIALGDLQRANNISNAGLIKPGQVLTLPGLNVAQAVEALSTTHTVEAGESLSQIAKDYGVSIGDIMRVNNITNANLVRPGQVLIIPPPSN